MTEKQKRLLDFIIECQGKGYTPSRHEMMEHMGRNSMNGICILLKRLEESGAITLCPGKKRMVIVNGQKNIQSCDEH